MIKTTLQGIEKEPPSHPFIAVHSDGVTVLFTSKDAGTVLASDVRSYKAGQYIDSWSLSYTKNKWRILEKGEQVILENA